MLYDDFTEASINTGLWVESLPQAGSTVSQSGGSLTTMQRGTLGTVSQFQAPLVVTGVVTMLSSGEHFDISLRSNLSTPGASGYYTTTGVVVEFAMDGEGYSIYNYASASNTNTLVVGSYRRRFRSVIDPTWGSRRRRRRRIYRGNARTDLLMGT